MILNALFILLSVGYFFYFMTSPGAHSRLVTEQSFWLKHSIITLLLLIICFIRYKFQNTFGLGDLYLCIPALFLLLIKAADYLTLKLHGRHLILAYKFNMASEETRNAHFTDYFWFILVYLIPLILPIFVYDVILGKKL